MVKVKPRVGMGCVLNGALPDIWGDYKAAPEEFLQTSVG